MFLARYYGKIYNAIHRSTHIHILQNEKKAGKFIGGDFHGHVKMRPSYIILALAEIWRSEIHATLTTYISGFKLLDLRRFVTKCFIVAVQRGPFQNT